MWKRKSFIVIMVATGLSLFVFGFAKATLYEMWKSYDIPFLPCNQERKELAAEFAVWGYDCSEEKNNILEERLTDFYKESEKGDVDGFIGYSVVSRYKTSLSASMTSSQSTVPASSVTTFDGHTLTMADLGSFVFLTIEAGSNKEEIVKCTGITGTSWTGCTRGLAFYGTTETAVVANQKTHNPGSSVVMSNVHYVYEQLVDKDTSQTLQKVMIFEQHPIASSTLGTPTTTYQYTTKQYVDNVTNQGAATSTEDVAGISELATQVENASSTQWGINDPHVQQSKHATSTPYSGMTGLYDVWTENDGKISQSFIDKTDNYDSTNAMTGRWAFDGTTLFYATSTMATTTIRELYNTTSTISTNLTLKGVDTANLVGGSTTNAQTLHTHTNLYNFVFSTSTATTFTNSTAETDLVTTSLPANSLGTKGFVKFRMLVSDLDIRASTASGEIFTGKFYLGTTPIVSLVLDNNNASDVDNLAGWIECTLRNTGTTNSQYGNCEMNVNQAPNTLPSDGGALNDAFAFAVGTATEDTTGDLTLKFSGDWSGATVESSITIQDAFVEVIPSNP